MASSLEPVGHHVASHVGQGIWARNRARNLSTIVNGIKRKWLTSGVAGTWSRLTRPETEETVNQLHHLTSISQYPLLTPRGTSLRSDSLLDERICPLVSFPQYEPACYH